MHLTYRWRATLVIALGLLMAILDITIVSVVLPQIATALHAEYQTSTWIGTGYLLANAAVIPIIGYLSDRAGSKTIFLLALGLFTLGSALCAFAPSVPALIAFRSARDLNAASVVSSVKGWAPARESASAASRRTIAGSFQNFLIASRS